MPVSIEEQYREFVRQNGGWTTHNIHLGGDLYTIGARPLTEEVALRRILQTVADSAGRPLDQLRVLDLGCAEGVFAIEFARHGAEVVGIEGRESHLLRARFVKEALGLERLQFHCDDARNLSVAKYGHFDVVLCIGLLYHLNEPDVFDFLARIAEVCTRVAVLHTHISIAPRLACGWQDRTYWGRHYLEHLPGDEKTTAGWASLDNETSYWITRASLLNALMDLGFTSVSEARVPFISWQPDDHLTLTAFKGQPVEIASAPALDTAAWERWPERRKVMLDPGQMWYFPAYRWLMKLLPAGPKAAVKSVVRRLRRSFGVWWATPRH